MCCRCSSRSLRFACGGFPSRHYYYTLAADNVNRESRIIFSVSEVAVFNCPSASRLKLLKLVMPEQSYFMLFPVFSTIPFRSLPAFFSLNRQLRISRHFDFFQLSGCHSYISGWENPRRAFAAGWFNSRPLHPVFRFFFIREGVSEFPVPFIVYGHYQIHRVPAAVDTRVKFVVSFHLSFSRGLWFPSRHWNNSRRKPVVNRENSFSFSRLFRLRSNSPRVYYRCEAGNRRTVPGIT